MSKTAKNETEKNPRQQIDDLVKEAHKKIQEAEKIADEHQETFSFDLAYGMGGTYFPEGWDDSWDSSEEGWVSSSAMC